MKPREQDRRIEERVPFLCEVECEAFGPGRSLRISDLSRTGAFIDTMSYVRVGSILPLKFKLRGAYIAVAAEVRHCVPQIGIGVRFLDLSAEDRMLIDLTLGELSQRKAAA
jgi:hypothetical protein